MALIVSAYLGGAELKKAFLGSTLLFDNTTDVVDVTVQPSVQALRITGLAPSVSVDDVLGYGTDVLGYGADELGYATGAGEVGTARFTDDTTFTDGTIFTDGASSAVTVQPGAGAAVVTGQVPTASGGSAGALPVTAGLRAHYDADAITDLVDADPVEQWDDESGAALHLVQATAANQPSYRTAVLNGKPIVRFDGNDIMDAPAFSATLGQPNTIFVVGKVAATGTGSSRVFIHGQTAGTLNSVFITGTDEFALFAGATLSGGTADTEFHVISGLFNGGSSEIWADGVSVAGPGDAGGQQYEAIRLGASSTGTSPLNGDIAEVLVYDRELAAQERQEIENHLTTKWLGGGNGAEIVNVEPGDDIAAASAAAPEGATIRLAAGTYTGVNTIFPKDGQTFEGVGGANAVILDGEVEIKRCFSTDTGENGAVNVTIQGLTITRFRGADGYPEADTSVLGPQPPNSLGQTRSGHWQRAAIQCTGEELFGGGRTSGWQVLDCNIVENHCRGVTLNKNGAVRRCKLNDNGLTGVGGQGRNNEVTDCEIARNNKFDADTHWESGGAKFVGGAGSAGTHPEVFGQKFLRNHVHHNDGPGYWFDFNGTDIEVANNSIHDNTSMAIQLEAAARFDVHHNQLGLNLIDLESNPGIFRTEMLFQSTKQSKFRSNLVYMNNSEVGPVKLGDQRPGADVDVGLFVGAENEVTDNSFILVAHGNFSSDNANKDDSASFHNCSNSDVNCTGTGTCYTAFTSNAPRSNTDTNFFCFTPNRGDDHHHVIDNNTYRLESGQPKFTSDAFPQTAWPPETNRTIISEAGATAGLEPDWTVIPTWDVPPGK